MRILGLLAVVCLVLSAFQPAVVCSEEPRAVAHGRLPSDPLYWKFTKWYLGHSVLDVYVNGREPGHLHSVLLELEKLNKRSVLIRDVVVIGGLNFAQLDASTRESLLSAQLDGKAVDVLKAIGIDPNLRAVAERLEFSEGERIADINTRLEQLGISHSPAWVVTYRGAQQIFEGVPGVTKYFSRTGQFRGTAGGEGKAARGGGLPLLPEQAKAAPGEPTQDVIGAYRYRLGKRRLPPGIGTFDVLPACSAAGTRRKPVYYNTDDLDDFDMTFYDYKDKSQRERAKVNRTPTVPYLEGDLYNPHRDKNNLQQGFGRFFDVRCLPTRVHFPYVGQNRVEEYVEGEAVWQTR